MSQKINICYFIGSLNIGGTERNMVKIAQKINKGRFNVTNIDFDNGGPLEEELKKSDIPYVFGDFTYDKHHDWIRRYPRFIWFLIKNKIHILHSLGYPTIYYGIRAGRIASVPILITTIQDYDYWKTEKELKKDKKVYKYAAKIIADGKGAMEFAIKQQGVNREKFEVIYDGVDPDELKPTKNASDLKKEFGIDANKKVVGIIARLDNKKKGQEYFIKAIPNVIKNHPNVQFLIVGDGADKIYLQKLTNDLNLKEYAIFTGSRTDLGDIIRLMNILIISSIWESVPKILLEAMYLKKPIIATNVGDIPEILHNNKNGFLIEPKNPQAISQKINYCLENPQYCQKLGRNAYQTIVNKSLLLENSVKKLENLYQKLMEENRSFGIKQILEFIERLIQKIRI